MGVFRALLAALAAVGKVFGYLRDRMLKEAGRSEQQVEDLEAREQARKDADRIKHKVGDSDADLSDLV